jgi:hypothetical protein|tara:strand:+ start:1359 stop:1700 length:342 start_codon:yes stop_codon:yes gene_type:complete
MQNQVRNLPTINWQKRAVRRLSKAEINKIASPPIEIENKPPPVKMVLAHVLKEKEMRMQDMYSYMARIREEIPDFHCAERTCREALFELKTAGKVKQRLCECGQATFYSIKKK